MSFGSVFFLEDDHDLGLTLKQLAAICGAASIWVPNVSSMIEQRDGVLNCKIAFLDIDLGRDQPTGLDAYEWLHKESYRGRVFFLSGHGKGHPIVAKALSLGKVDVLAKPFSPTVLLDLIEGRQ